jgi:hypothetical protein
LQLAYEIFKNTYANDKQRFLESLFNMIARIKGATDEMHIVPLEPISFQLTEQTLVGLVPKEYLLEKAGIDLSKYQSTAGNAVNGQPDEQALAVVNDSLRNMSGRQYQHLMRVIRQFSQGKINKEQATVMLKSGLGMNDQEINSMLGIDDDPETEDQQFSEVDLDGVIGVFEEFGEAKDNFQVLSTRSVFSAADTFADDYLVDATADKKILELLQKDKLIPNEVIAQAIGRSLEFVQRRIQYLYDVKAIVKNEITKERTLTAPIRDLVDKPLPTVIEVRYSYEWKPQFAVSQEGKASTPLIEASRPFCARLLRLNKVYTRREIEALTARFGYSVFDRGGGWWTKPSGYHSPSCRHEWRANVLVRKK